MAPVKIPRTSAGLRDALFEAIEALRAGDIEPAEAKMIANLAHEICSTVQVEVQVHAARLSRSGVDQAIPILQLGEAKVEDQ